MAVARWYVIHVYSGFEKKVAQSIREQADSKGMGDLIEQVLVPTEEVVEVDGHLLCTGCRLETGALTAADVANIADRRAEGRVNQ